jgi:hypothetical protein
MKNLKSFSQFITENMETKSDFAGHRHQVQKVEDIKNFIFAGNAVFTIESVKTGKWFTFEINKPKDNDKLFFVSVLRGPNNTDDYTYVGVVDKYDSNFSFRLTKGSKLTEETTCVQAFKVFINNLQKNYITPNMNFYHMGYCGRCGKALTTPLSVERGIGPVCFSIPDKTKKK